MKVWLSLLFGLSCEPFSSPAPQPLSLSAPQLFAAGELISAPQPLSPTPLMYLNPSAPLHLGMATFSGFVRLRGGRGNEGIDLEELVAIAEADGGPLLKTQTLKPGERPLDRIVYPEGAPPLEERELVDEGHDWATEEDVPEEAKELKAEPKFASEELRLRVANTAEALKEEIQVDGRTVDVTLYDMILVSQRRIDGSGMAMTVKQVKALLKCFKDPEAPTPAEIETIKWMVDHCQLETPARELVSERMSELQRSNPRKRSHDNQRRGAENSAESFISDMAMQLDQPEDEVGTEKVLTDLIQRGVQVHEAPAKLVLGVKKLRKSKNIKVKNAARALFDSWRRKAGIE